VIDIAEKVKVKGARLRWYGHVIRRDEGRDVKRYYGMKRSELRSAEKVGKARLGWYEHVLRRDIKRAGQRYYEDEWEHRVEEMCERISKY
jgi:hypothetical protein